LNIKKESYCSRWRKHKALLDKAESLVNRKLDLGRFFLSQRMLLLTALASLSSRQRHKLQKVAPAARWELANPTDSDSDLDFASNALFGPSAEKPASKTDVRINRIVSFLSAKG